MSTSIMRTSSAPRRRRRWSAAEKAACVTAFAASGQSETAFCRAAGVSRTTLRLWLRTARQTSAPAGSGFAAVEVVASAPPGVTPGVTPALATAVTTSATALGDAHLDAHPDAHLDAHLDAHPDALPDAPLRLTLALEPSPTGLTATLTGVDAAGVVTVLRGLGLMGRMDRVMSGP